MVRRSLVAQLGVSVVAVVAAAAVLVGYGGQGSTASAAGVKTARSSGAVSAAAPIVYGWGAATSPPHAGIPLGFARRADDDPGTRTVPGRNPRGRKLPTPVDGIAGTVLQISTSNSDGYALTSAGAVYAWGLGSAGELGDGLTPRDSAIAVRVNFPAGVRIVSLPDPMPLDGGMAIGADGTVWAWGNNGGQQFCRTTTPHLLTPVTVPLPDVTLAAGAFQHTIYDSDGHIVTCGRGRLGQLGNGTGGTTGASATPVAVKGLPRGVAVAVTDSWGDAGVLMADGAYYDWGYNGAGQLGDGTETLSGIAVQVPLPGGVRQVSQGGSTAANGQTLALLGDGELWEWGNGRFGQMGNGGTANALSPILLTEPPGADFVTVNSGGATNYALGSDGNLWAWGRDDAGQVGDGTFALRQTRPVSDHLRLTQVSSTASDVAGYGPTTPLVPEANGH
jgi:alpha-tubulin suppressor-like RCC1 family protein